jgi:hypothetical protein
MHWPTGFAFGGRRWRRGRGSWVGGVGRGLSAHVFLGYGLDDAQWLPKREEPNRS